MSTAVDIAIEATGLIRRYGKVEALRGATFTVRRGDFFSLLGPSGSGKTTLLRVIAGLEQPDEGTLMICGQSARNFPAHRRPVNMVFQSYALFPHLTVSENIVFGLRMRRLPDDEIERRLQWILEVAKIVPLADRKPAQLDGGEQQRVALCRALVNEPQILLLDEPLNAVDFKLRQQLQLDLRMLQQRLHTTFIYVTHDHQEALTMSTQIAVMNRGRIEQMGDPETLYEKPLTRFVASYMGSCNVFEGRISKRGLGGVIVATPIGELRLADGSVDTMIHLDDKVAVALRPEKVEMHNEPPLNADHILRGTVSDAIYNGAETHFAIQIGGARLKARAPNNQPRSRRLFPGRPVYVSFPSTSVLLLKN